MEDIKLRDSEEKATELINQQLKNIIDGTDTESLNSGFEDFDIPDVSNLPTLEEILAQNDPLLLLDNDIRQDIDNIILLDDDLMSVISSNSFSSTGRQQIVPQEMKTKRKEHGEVVKFNSYSLLGGMCNRDDKATAIAIKNKLVCIGFQSGKISVMMIDGQVKGELSSNKTHDSGSVTSLDIADGVLVASYSTGVLHVWELKNCSHTQKVDVKLSDSTVIRVVVLNRNHILYVVSQGSVFDVKLTKTLSIRSSESTCLFSGSHGEVLDFQKLTLSENHPLQKLCLVALCTFKQVMLISLRPYPNIKYSIKLWGDTSTVPVIKWYYHAQDCDKPKLVIGRGCRFVLYSLNIDARDQLFLRKTKSCSLEFQLIAIFWFNTNTIGVLDCSEKVHLIDVHSLSRLQTITSVSNIGLCYNTAFYRSLGTGGNVSKAMFAASQYACYNSVVSYPGATWLLGSRDVIKVSSTPWRNRIHDLRNDLHFASALDLALTFYNGKAKGVSSMVFKNMPKVQESCLELILEIFIHYLEEAQQDLGQLGKALKNCIKACVATNCSSLIYEEIYLRMSKVGPVQRVFYETLEPFVFNNQIRSLNPVLMKDLLEYFQENDKLQSFEKCILHLDPINLDIHNTLILCKEYDLYEALLFIYNACLMDYTTPLNSLLELLSSQLLENNHQHKQVGYVILMYISDCLTGNIPQVMGMEREEDEVTRVQNIVFNLVFCRHSERSEPAEPDYPFVKLILKLDTREFLNVMSVTFSHPLCLPLHQIVIDILLYVMVEDDQNYSPLQIGHLFTFLARQKVVTEFYLDKKYLDQALDCLATNDITGHEEREQALLELVLTIGIAGFNEDRLLSLSESAEFYQVCELIYEKREEYDKVLFCYWSDTSRIDKVFSYIYHIMEGNFSESDKLKIRETCVQNIDKLITINNEDTATLILNVFSEDIQKIVCMLEDQPRTLYSLLQCVFDITKGTEEPDINNFDVHHLYIKLMSRYNPEFVCPYLQVATGYNLDTILELCLIANLKDAAAYLYEVRGDLADAFKLYYDVLRDTIERKQMVFIEETLIKIINFCQRNSNQLNQNDKESYWFSLIDLLLGLGEAPDCISLQETLIDNMLGFVSSSKVLDKLIKSSSNKSFKTYGDIKKVVGNMLDTLMYEDVLLNSTKKIVQGDIHTQLRQDRDEFVRGIDINRNMCVLCCQYITPASDFRFFIFSCSHLAHTSCVDYQRQKYCVLCESDHSISKQDSQIINRAVSIDNPYHQSHFESWREGLLEMRDSLRGQDRLELIHELCEDGYEKADSMDDDYNVDLTADLDEFYREMDMDSFMSSAAKSTTEEKTFSSRDETPVDQTTSYKSFQKVSKHSRPASPQVPTNKGQLSPRKSHKNRAAPPQNYTSRSTTSPQKTQATPRNTPSLRNTPSPRHTPSPRTTPSPISSPSPASRFSPLKRNINTANRPQPSTDNNPFGEDDTNPSSEAENGNPFGEETQSTAGSGNPFGEDDDTNPFGDDDYNPFAEDI